MQFGAGEHSGGALQPQQPAGDVGAAAGGVRRQHREVLCHLPTGQRRKPRALYIPDRWRPGCGERESPQVHNFNNDFLKVVSDALCDQSTTSIRPQLAAVTKLLTENLNACQTLIIEPDKTY